MKIKNLDQLRNLDIKKKNDNGNRTTVLAAAAGIAVGAGATAFAAKALSDKKTKAKVKKALSDAKSQVSEKIVSFSKDALEGKRNAKKVISKSKKKVKKITKPRRSSK